MPQSIRSGMQSISRAVWVPLLLAPLLLAARCPVPGQTTFTSAQSPTAFRTTELFLPPMLLATASAPVATDGEISEGDLFRVLAPGLLLNLNAYRGLQVIDVSDVTKPAVVGRVPVTGSPVELYVAGDTAFVLVNGTTLRGASFGEDAGQDVFASGTILSVDLGDPAHPTVIDQATVPGSISASRLNRNGNRAALYVVSNEWTAAATDSGYRTLVSGFDVASDHVTPVAQSDVGGYATAVQATPEMLMIALAEEWWSGASGSRVTLIDIRDASGAIAFGDEVAVTGRVHDQFNMDYRDGIVRIVSGRRFGVAGDANHLETFDASDPANVVPVDTVSFGANEDLFATLFLGNRAFAVTYLRVDPFHTFEISDAGVITPGAHFEVSGWNNFFRAVFDDSRLIGVGIDDQGSRSLAVSLYDVSDIANPEPLLARERVAAGSDSVANWDHQGFSVLEDAVAVPGPGGVTETGLVLLPASDWMQASAGVQIFTFSADTLTRRGVMEHGDFVQRSFEADDDLVANISDTRLSLFATADPDHPVERGRLDLAPDYRELFRFGEYWVRVAGSPYPLFYWEYDPLPQAPQIVDVTAGDADPDFGAVIASFEIPSGAQLYRSGPYLVSVVHATDGVSSSEVRVFDLRDPAHPAEAGSLLTDRLSQTWNAPYRGGPIIALCFSCYGGWYRGTTHVEAVPDGLAFVQGGPAGDWSFDLLDLRDPAAPILAERIDSDDVPLDGDAQATSLLVDGHHAWVGLEHALRADRSGRSASRHFALRIDVSNPGALTTLAPINVPGELIAVAGDELFTRDSQWNGDVVDTAVVRLALEADKARVEAVHWFENRRVDDVRLDGAGHILVSHGAPWQGFYMLWSLNWRPPPQPADRLTVLDADSADLDALADVAVARGATLVEAIPGRALFATSTGLLVFDLDDASNPLPRSYFPTTSWVDEVRVESRTAYTAAGRYGILHFDLDASNFAPPARPSRLRVQ